MRGTFSMSQILEPLPKTFEFQGNLALSEEHKSILNWQANISETYYGPVSRQDENIAQEFYKLAAQWKKETRFLSSILEISTHPSYQKIIGMGPAAVPLILTELRRSPTHWFWALKAISRIDPVPTSHRGNIEKMAEFWLKWGTGQGYVF